jgi:TRAP-type C4-dicarboxylate transport system permease small subunit
MKKMLSVVNWFSDIWISLALCMMLVVIMLDIFFREALNRPLTWHLEISQYCLINVTYIGAAVAHRKKAHISINLFTSMLPRLKERYVNLAGKILTFPFLVLLILSSADILKKAKGVTPSLQLPIWTYYAPILIGSVFLAFYSVLAVLVEIKEIRAGRGGVPCRS